MWEGLRPFPFLPSQGVAPEIRLEGCITIDYHGSTMPQSLK